MLVAGQIEAGDLVAMRGGDRFRVQLQCNPSQQVVRYAAVIGDALHSLLQVLTHQLCLRGTDQRFQGFGRGILRLRPKGLLITQELQHTAFGLHHQRLIPQGVLVIQGNSTQALLFVRIQGHGPGKCAPQVTQRVLHTPVDHRAGEAREVEMAAGQRQFQEGFDEGFQRHTGTRLLCVRRRRMNIHRRAGQRRQYRLGRGVVAKLCCKLVERLPE